MTVYTCKMNVHIESADMSLKMAEEKEPMHIYISSTHNILSLNQRTNSIRIKFSIFIFDNKVFGSSNGSELHYFLVRNPFFYYYLHECV